jgi:hypothetical protein
MEIFDHSLDPTSHDRFLRWRQQHPGGFIVNRTSDRKGKLHFARCSHLFYVSDGSARMTKRVKVCSTDRAEIEAWAHANQQVLEECDSCKSC